MTAAELLKKAGGSVGRAEGELLLCHVTGKSKIDLLINDDLQICENDSKVFLRLAERLSYGEPLQYIIGEWQFFGLNFKVGPEALIPRMETELLVEAAVRRINEKGAKRVADVGTGCGCIAAALATNTDARVVASDVCPKALALAKKNAELNGLDARIEFVLSDVFDGFTRGRGFDAIVSNPPYIPSSDIGSLESQVRDYEPKRALDGGMDGLSVYRKLIPGCVLRLKRGGRVFLEIGPLGGVVGLLEKNGFVNINVINDYSGIPRIVAAELKDG